MASVATAASLLLTGLILEAALVSLGLVVMCIFMCLPCLFRFMGVGIHNGTLEDAAAGDVEPRLPTVTYQLAMAFASRTGLTHPAGLRPEELKSLPSFAYHTANGTDSVEQYCCIVCRDQFQKNELVRRLRKCKHLFHAMCIDRWLSRMPTCPLCRCRVELEPRAIELQPVMVLPAFAPPPSLPPTSSSPSTTSENSGRLRIMLEKVKYRMLRLKRVLSVGGRSGDQHADDDRREEQLDAANPYVYDFAIYVYDFALLHV
ncbi:hypothetical protein Taro_046426 [Colocasia esculenta]|uniref:RING-type domain-containing protein n=1 Tax=Colocasia esculenta TaxID=4460 RepID=A0A843WYU9_COLES|nr:hypothetical protein [Colocasia esculenta]